MPEFEASQFLRREADVSVDDVYGHCWKGEADVEDVGAEYGFVFAPGAKRPDGWPYRFPSTNTTILYHWSSTLCDLEPLNPSDRVTSYAMHLDRPPAFLKSNLYMLHVLVLNTGGR
ncbi:Protein trichome birefringence-like 16 [Zea mays]|nr:Protein trichome birefringence-like 16 [Zea mays]